LEEYKKIYNEVKKILSPVYLVGGSVRDVILNREPKDYDFCCPHTPDEIEGLIRQSKNKHGDNRKAYNVGKRYGTLGCKVSGHDVEITTFRTEIYTPQNRKPEVEFVQDITADLSRRDFTMNAIAYRDGRFIDPHGGKIDIMTGNIKAVGEPKKRIKEDPLRMLRCARFTSQLGFEVDQYLYGYIKKCAYKILHISKERWVQEIDKILMSDNPIAGLDILMDSGLFRFILPELSIQKDYDQNNDHHQHDLWTHTKLTVDATPREINIRWAALLHDIAKPFTAFTKRRSTHYYYHDYLGGDMVERIARHLKWPNERRTAVKKLVLEHLSVNSELREYDRSAH